MEKIETLRSILNGCSSSGKLHDDLFLDTFSSAISHASRILYIHNFRRIYIFVYKQEVALLFVFPARQTPHDLRDIYIHLNYLQQNQFSKTIVINSYCHLLLVIQYFRKQNRTHTHTRATKWRES